MSRLYAERTTVPVSRSQAEVHSLLRKFGAQKVMLAQAEAPDTEDFDCHIIGFEKDRVPVRYEFRVPNFDDREARRQWRCAVLFLKSKLILIEEEVSSFEKEFMPWVALPGGVTVGDVVGAQMRQAIAGGELPRLLE